MEPNKIKPAAIGGAIAGVLSVIPVVGICCCLWTLGGGYLAAHLYNKETGGRGLTPGDGATLGAIAGGIGAAIYFVVTIPLTIILGPVQEAFLKQLGYDLPTGGMASGIVGAIIGGIVGAIIIAVLTTLGGLIGALVNKPK